jgi:transposase
MKSYKTWTPTQPYLLPPSPLEWLPEGHLVYFMLDVVEELDLSPIEDTYQAKDRRGTRPYAPHMMVALLLYGYCVGVYSSRKLEKATYEDVGFRVLSGGYHPDHTRISEFRRQHLENLRGLFLQVLRLCMKAGLVKLGHVALDGTKVQANASKHKAMSYDRMVEMEKRLKVEIDELLTRAESTDKAEDERYGEGVRGDELPEELRRRESRLERIRQAKKELEREARHARTAVLQEQAERARQRSEKHPDPVERKRAATVSKRKAAEAEQMVDDDDEPPSATGPGGLPHHRPKTKLEGTPDPKAQRNFTDSDSRIMESGGSFLQGYNSQLAVDDEHQIILAQDITNQASDNGNFTPMVEQVVDNCEQAPKVTTADAGYWSPEAARDVEKLGTDAHISTERRKHWQTDTSVTGGPPPDDADELRKMRHKLRATEGRAIYARRKAIVEPVNGQIKEARRFRRFLLRGFDKVRAEWALVCTGHNLLKLYRAQPAAALATPA